MAEVSGDATPYAFQHLRRRALWDPDAVRDELRYYIVQHLADAAAVLVLDETGFLKKGHHPAGVARQYRGTAGQVDNCQMGVFLGDASALGQALLDRELYVPEEWTDDRERCQDSRDPGRPALRDQAPAGAPAAGADVRRWRARPLGHGRPRLWP